MKKPFWRFVQVCIPCCCFTTQVAVTAVTDIALNMANMDSHIPGVNAAIDEVFTPATTFTLDALDIIIKCQEENTEVVMPKPTDHPIIRNAAGIIEQVTNTSIHLVRDAACAAVEIYLEQKKASTLSPLAQSVITRTAQAVENVTDFVIHTTATTTMTIAEYILPPTPSPIPESIDNDDNKSVDTDLSDFVSVAGNSAEDLTNITTCNVI
jgi:hypothetical protein